VSRSGLEAPSTAWFERDALDVAPGLLGAHLRVGGPDGVVVVRLTEVEAYRGADDPGSHAFRGRTRRNDAMFEAGGVLYVYFTYGMHHCVNVVCGPAGEGSAVLLRAGEIVAGRDAARARRSSGRQGSLLRDADLARGPARLAGALGLTLADDGMPLVPGGRADLLVPSSPPEAVGRGPRVGVAGPGGEAAGFPWRFWLPGEPTVSLYRAARPRTPRFGSADRGVPGRSTPPGTAD
jgi:DNA-3-methyladenine glycosylase